MNVWVLFVILLQPTTYVVVPQSMHMSMAECFQARDAFMATAPQPKINYDAICIQSDRIQTQ